MKIFKWLSIITVLILGGVFLWLGNPQKTNLKLGLDLIGGAQLIFKAEKTPEIQNIDYKIMQSVEKNIQNRINLTGTAETTVQKVGNDKILVEIPGQSPDVVKRRLLKTAKLEFKELKEWTNDKNKEPIWVNSGLSGADIKNVQALMDNNSEWMVNFEIKAESAQKFAEVTGRLYKGILPNGEKAPSGSLPMAIFLDDEFLSAPRVQAQLNTGGIINGSFTKEKAEDLAANLNAGALPVPLKLISERTVSATLGNESLIKSLNAGLIGLAIIALFFIGVYRLFGLLACIALISYIIISLGLFTKTITLTSEGIGGFILSIGMATDANILIFERIKEEVRNGKGILRAAEEGFARAFPSIFDSNLNTLLVCTVLLIFGTGLVKGFAITLALGVIISFFSAIVLTRELVFLSLKVPFLQNKFLLGVEQINNEKNRIK